MTSVSLFSKLTDQSGWKWLLSGLLCISLLSVPAPVADQPAAESPNPSHAPVSNRLVGSWKLILVEEFNAAGERVEPLDYGTEPIGIIMYDTTGHMSVHAMRRGRSRFPSEDIHLAPAELAKEAFVGYGAYFGTYTVNEKEGIVIHHVQGSLIPNWEGSEQRRRFTLVGDKLTLEPPAFQAKSQQRTRRLTWQRIQ